MHCKQTTGLFLLVKSELFKRNRDNVVSFIATNRSMFDDISLRRRRKRDAFISSTDIGN